MLRKSLKIFIPIFSLLMFSNISSQETWIKRFHKGTSSLNFGLYVKQLEDRNIIFTGCVSRDVVLMKTNSYGDSLWSAIYTQNRDWSIGYCVDITQDDGFIVTGTKGGKSFLIKTDGFGSYKWEKFYDNTTSGNYVNQSDDGGYFVVGDLFNMKTDFMGNVSWIQYYTFDYDLLGGREKNLIPVKKPKMKVQL